MHAKNITPKRTINQSTLAELFANKFAFKEDEEILVNALDLCDELWTKDFLLRENARLKSRIAWLETIHKPIEIYVEPEPQYKRFSVRA